MTAYPTAYGPPADSTNVVGRRIGAWSIDLIIYLVLVVVAIGASGTWETDTIAVERESIGDAYCDAWRVDNDGICSYSNGDVLTVAYDPAFITGAFLFNLVGYIVIQGLAGGSLGKLAVGLRVVDQQGRQAGLGKSAIRTLLWAVDAITCGFPVLGGVLLVSTKGHRRVGDMAAGTYVVDKSHLGQAVVVPGVTTGWPGTPGGYPPVGGYGQQPGYGAQPGYGQAPTSWQPPAPGSQASGGPTAFPPGPPVAPAEPTSAPSGDGPTWDQARSAYIQYDRDQSAWVQWDESSKQWRPIDQ